MKNKSILTKIKIKVFYATLIFRYKNTSTINQNYFNWKVYKYLEKKYKKLLNKLPFYESTNKYSNKVWWCWFQGEENIPKLQKICLASLRRFLNDREIIIITKDNLSDYVDIPSYILKKYQNGIISNAHFSDIIRLELLIKYGGTWIDSTVYCTNYNKRFFDKNLFVYNAFMRGDESIASSSWFITSDINNPILMTTRDLLYEYWRKHNYMINYYLFHLFFNMAVNKYPELYAEVGNFPNTAPHILQFEFFDKFNESRFEEIKKMSDFHKLNGHWNEYEHDITDTFYDYIVNKEKI